MAGAGPKRRKSKRKTRTDWYLLALMGLAVVVLGSFIWVRFQARTRHPAPTEVDFADRLRQLAAARGLADADVVADDPIRKVDGVFVRSWRFSAPNRVAMEALEHDIELAAGDLHAAVSRAPSVSDEKRRMRIDFDDEAFDLEFALARPRRLAQQQPGATEVPSPGPPKVTARPRPSPGARGRLAILLDDAGQSRDLLEEAAALPAAVGFSVLPFLPHTAEIANALHDSGHEVWLHMPMEPEDYPKNNPGPGALLVTMSDAEMRLAVHDAINDVPHVVGINNHMGSKATADLRTMTWVMQELKSRGMKFIDSRTSRETVAEQAAIAQGVPAGRRHVFLDNVRTPDAILRQLDEAVDRCRLDGHAIAIGHVDRITVDVLAEALSGLSRKGADLVSPSALVK